MTEEEPSLQEVLTKAFTDPLPLSEALKGARERGTRKMASQCEHNKPMYGCMQCAPQGKRIAELETRLAEAQASNRQLVEACEKFRAYASHKGRNEQADFFRFLAGNARNQNRVCADTAVWDNVAGVLEALSTPSAKRAQAEARVLELTGQYYDAVMEYRRRENTTTVPWGIDVQNAKVHKREVGDRLFKAVEALRAEEGV